MKINLGKILSMALVIVVLWIMFKSLTVKKPAITVDPYRSTKDSINKQQDQTDWVWWLLLAS